MKQHCYVVTNIQLFKEDLSLFYADLICPIISPGLGGGLPIRVELIGDKDKAEILKALVPMGDTYRTIPLDLLDETDTTYIVLALYTGGNTKQPVIVYKDLIKCIDINHKWSIDYFVLWTSSLSRFHVRASNTPAMIIRVVNMPVLVIKSCILIIPVV